MAPDRPADKLFEVLRSLGPGWHTRAEIARKLGKPRVTGYEAALLDVLIGDGLVEAERQSIAGPIGFQWFYRVKD